MTLGEKQERFAVLLKLLLLHAHALGYNVRLKHVLRCRDCPVGRPDSVHKHGLAVDLVLSLGGRVTWADQHYAALHDYWDSLGGAARIPGDLGHFSIAHGGVR